MKNILNYSIKDCNTFSDSRLEEIIQGWLDNNKFNAKAYAFGDNEEISLGIDYIDDEEKAKEIAYEVERLMDSLKIIYEYSDIKGI